MVLLAPGHVLMQTLFARHDDIDGPERLALTLGLSIAMPYWLVDQTQCFALVSLQLIVATLVAARYLRYVRLQLGITLGGLPWQLPAVASGAAIGYLERLIIQPAPLAHGLAIVDLLIVLPNLGGWGSDMGDLAGLLGGVGRCAGSGGVASVGRRCIGGGGPRVTFALVEDLAWLARPST